MIHHTVIDNFLSEGEFKQLYNIIMGHEFPWSYTEGIANADDYSQGFYFVHTLLCQEDDRVFKSSNYDVIAPIVQRLEIKKVIRAKANLYIRSSKMVVHGRHQDQVFSHIGAVFYVNTNDGGTVLNDGTKVQSVQNRILIFDSSTPHSSTSCTDQNRRVNINLNCL